MKASFGRELNKTHDRVFKLIVLLLLYDLGCVRREAEIKEGTVSLPKFVQ